MTVFKTHESKLSANFRESMWWEREERREAKAGGDEGRKSAKGSSKWGRQKGGERRGKIGKKCLAESELKRSKEERRDLEEREQRQCMWVC